MTTIRVAVAGAYGKMGSETVKTVLAAADMELVAGIVRVRDEAKECAGVPYFTEFRQCLIATMPDVLVEFTHYEVANEHIAVAIDLGIRPVIGTTGFDEAELRDYDCRLRDARIGGLYAPNFAIGALLMMRLSTLAAPFLPDVEIIEYHHAGKKDAPSGTAKKTAERLALARKNAPQRAHIAHPGSADMVAGIPVHSVRLPGFVAHQEVIFGGHGERLSIRHDSMTRESFMPGVLLGVRGVMKVEGLVDGLEHFLF